MPILDASSLPEKSEDGDVLRGILGQVTHGPIHADEMRAAAVRASSAFMRRDPALCNALRNAEKTRRMLINRLHSSA